MFYLRAATALSTHAQNDSYGVVGVLNLDSVCSMSGNGALYTCTKQFYNSVVVKINCLEKKKRAAGAKK